MFGTTYLAELIHSIIVHLNYFFLENLIDTSGTSSLHEYDRSKNESQNNYTNHDGEIV